MIKRNVVLSMNHRFIITRKDKKKSWLCIYHHFIIARKDKEKLRYVYIITSLQQGMIKRNVVLSMNHRFIITRKDKKKSWLCIYHHFIITRKDKEKLRYVNITTSLQQRRIKNSCGMYISSLHYNKEG